MELLTTCQTLQEALIVQSILRGSGIESVIPDEYTAQNGLIIVQDGIRVLVEADKWGDAQKALEESPESEAPSA